MRRQEAKGGAAVLTRRIQLLEADLLRSEERFATATQKLTEVSHAADESEGMRNVLDDGTVEKLLSIEKRNNLKSLEVSKEKASQKEET